MLLLYTGTEEISHCSQLSLFITTSLNPLNPHVLSTTTYTWKVHFNSLKISIHYHLLKACLKYHQTICDTAADLGSGWGYPLWRMAF